MPFKKAPLPDEGEVVMCTVADIQRTHIYLLLDEYHGLGKGHNRETLPVPESIKYNAMSYMHISELANHWIKNIRDFVREGQKIVVKVLKVDPAKGHVDVSKRRVSGAQKMEMVREFKRANKVEGLLKLLGERTGMDLDETYEKVGYPLEEAYGTIWSAFEDILEGGIDAIMDLEFVEELDEKVLKELESIVQQYVEIPTVKMVGEFELVSYAPDGVDVIKKAINEGLKVKPPKGENISITFQLLASPRYRMEMEASDYQVAESYLTKVEEKIIGYVEKTGGHGVFIRA